WERSGAEPLEHTLTLEEASTRYVAYADSIAADIYVTGPGRTRAHPESALLAVRIRIGQHVDGFLVFEKRRAPLAFAQSDLELVKALKEPFVSAFQKASALRVIEQERAGAQAANRAKSEFLTNISHEIRTPINAILGFAGLGSHLDLPAKPLDYFRKIGRAGNSLLGIINDVLDFSKIESGKLELEAVPFDLHETLGQIADLFSWRAAEKDLELVVWAAPSVPPILVGDPLRLNQVLVNLVGNALKFTDKGTIELRVDLESPVDEPLDKTRQVRLRFTVEDTGVGISPDQQSRLFHAFAQADASTTRLYGGTGLGLAISQDLVGKMGGSISLHSQPGVGSRFAFSVTLPCAPVHDARPLLAHGEALGRRVLVVDDSAPTRAMLEAQLRSFGFDAHAVGSGDAALFALQLEPYDVVLMDWNMPGLNGIDTARRIKGDASLAAIPAIIMVTAYARDTVRQGAEQAGINGFMVKPVTPALLLDGVLGALGVQQATPAADALPYAYANTAPIEGSRVLVVDDNGINLQVASEILQRASVVVEQAASGAEALQLIDANRYDAVLMDIQMPEMDGYQATQHIRAQERHAGLPVIAMTAHAMSGYRERCLAMGMNDYITKPIDPSTLFAVLAKWVPARAQATPAPGLVAAPPAPRPPAGMPVPALPGIDMVAALSRLGGNLPLLKRLLRLFATDFADSLEQVDAALARSDFDGAAVLVHKLKGAAGNLAAQDLHAVAGELEAALLAQDAPALPGLLTALASAVNEVMQAARECEHEAAQAS
ncbi:MAG: response regulator, partial [Gammaproteobacteria bacterium]